MQAQNTSPLQEIGQLSSHFAASVVELGELQWELFIADSKATYRQSIRSILILLIASAFCLVGLPIIAIGIAHGLHEWMRWPLWASYLGTGAAFLMLGSIASIVAFKQAAVSFQCYRRSTGELSANIHWLKNILRGTNSNL